MVDLDLLQHYLSAGKYDKAHEICPFEEAKKLADQGNAVGCFATAAYYYHGIGCKQKITYTIEYCTKAAKLGYPHAEQFLKDWIKEEKFKNYIGMITFFEMFLCLPGGLVLGVWLINNYANASGVTLTLMHISLIVPIAATIWLMRFMLRNLDFGMMKMSKWAVLILPFVIPVTLVFMAVVYFITFFILDKVVHLFV